MIAQDDTLSFRLARIVSSRAETCLFVRSMDSPVGDAKEICEKYEQWLAAQFDQILHPPKVNND